jgi:hypothetical protein
MEVRETMCVQLTLTADAMVVVVSAITIFIGGVWVGMRLFSKPQS